MVIACEVVVLDGRLDRLTMQTLVHGLALASLFILLLTFTILGLLRRTESVSFKIQRSQTFLEVAGEHFFVMKFAFRTYQHFDDFFFNILAVGNLK